ncbi:unnamed protein product [Lampetra planeri]
MAEYSQQGLFAALLLFTALTLRDVYNGRATSQSGQQPAEIPGLSPDRLPETEPGKPAKPSLYTGPVLRFQYWCLGNMISYLKFISILLIISGQNVFVLLGLNTPRAWTWTQDNKVFSCLMAFFLCNMMETHFLSTGAFEITLNECGSTWKTNRSTMSVTVTVKAYLLGKEEAVREIRRFAVDHGRVLQLRVSEQEKLLEFSVT